MSKNPATAKIWTVVELIDTTTRFFAEKKIENPRLNAELLLAGLLNYKRVELYLHFDRHLRQTELSDYREMVKRRAQREPLQYILGQVEFLGLNFRVSPAALIPRPETELLTEYVMNKLKEEQLTQGSIIDIGTGSGCIAISLAHLLAGSRVYGCDVSPQALQLAQDNARHILENGSAPKEIGEITFAQYDVFAPWPAKLPKTFDVLVSNPPYIATEEMTSLEPEVVDYEPHIALSDGEDGLKFYRRLFELAKKEIKVSRLFLEMSGSQPQKIIAETEPFGFKQITVQKDLNQIDRILDIRV